MSSSVAAIPLWKYGARADSARSVGVLNFPRSLHKPVTLPLPVSVNCRSSPVARLRMVYRGRSGVRASAEAAPISKSASLKFVPLFAELWQPLQLRPFPALGLLNNSCPWEILARASLGAYI